MKKTSLLFLFLFSASLYSQSILGTWKTFCKNNKEQVLIEVYQKNEKIHARIIKVLDPKLEGKVCEKCKGESKNKPIKGLTIIQNLVRKNSGTLYRGYALDPLSEKYYKCKVIFKNQNTLKLRSYIGISLLGKTEYWHRVL
jgi:uncharacterized protein (DUF2147 family)